MAKHRMIVTKGLPGSGKTTWAHEYIKTHFECKIICKDDLRDMFDNGRWSKISEHFVIQMQTMLILEMWDRGLTPIIADTNLNPVHLHRFEQLAEDHGAQLIVQDFTDVPLDECIRRDLLRPRSVGEQVIRKQYNKWLRVDPEPVKWVPGLPPAIIVDMDGTLAIHAKDRNPYDHSQIHTDIPNFTLYHSIISGMRMRSELIDRIKLKLIVVSGRDGSARLATESWLRFAGFEIDDMFMRPEGDNRKDVIIKRELYEAHIKDKYNVVVVFDDRNQVVELWREMGLPCYQVAFGDF